MMDRRGNSGLALAAAFAPALAACGDVENAAPPPAGPSTAAKVPLPEPDATGFVDRAPSAGFTFLDHTGKAERKDSIVEAKGGGALVLDSDGDGRTEVCVDVRKNAMWINDAADGDRDGIGTKATLVAGGGEIEEVR